jgi:hypothetical protein
MGSFIDLAKGSAAILVGQALGRTISTKIPIGDLSNPFLNAAKSGVVAIAIRKFGARAVGPDLARLAAMGAFASALQQLIVSVVPQAASFLGASDSVMILPAIPGRDRIGVYSADTGDNIGPLGAYAAYAPSSMGSYTSDGYPG